MKSKTIKVLWHKLSFIIIFVRNFQWPRATLVDKSRNSVTASRPATSIPSSTGEFTLHFLRNRCRRWLVAWNRLSFWCRNEALSLFGTTKPCVVMWMRLRRLIRGRFRQHRRFLSSPLTFFCKHFLKLLECFPSNIPFFWSHRELNKLSWECRHAQSSTRRQNDYHNKYRNRWLACRRFSHEVFRQFLQCLSLLQYSRECQLLQLRLFLFHQPKFNLH